MWDFRSRVITYGVADHLAVEFGNVKADKTLLVESPDTPAWACPIGVWVVRMTRALNSVSSGIFPLCSGADATALAARLKVPNEKATNKTHNEMVIVNSINRSPGGPSLTLRNLPAALAEIGVAKPTFATTDLSTTAFSVWGVPGMSAGQAYTTQAPISAEQRTKDGELSPAGIKGEFAKDAYQNYALENTDYQLYDVAADGGIKVGERQYPVPGGGTNGFHVLVLDDRTLGRISDDFYPTTATQDLFAFGRAMSDLAKAPEVLVLVASVGNPVGESAKPGPLTMPDKHCSGSAAFVITCRFPPTDENERGAEQSLVVPTTWQGAPVTQLEVTMQGGHGGGAKYGGVAGEPARVSTVLPVDGTKLSGGQTLYIEVGGHGADGANSGAGVGGFNGGGSGSSSIGDFTTGWPGGGGGGASDIRTVPRSADADRSLESRIVIAGGGGGAGGDAYSTGRGGDGGQAGGDGTDGHADKGDPVGGGGRGAVGRNGGAGGSGKIPGAPGRLGAGGNGGDGSNVEGKYGFGGGGGGGYAGGGSGGQNRGSLYGGGGGGGGGGSSLVPPGGSIESVATDESGFVDISFATPNGVLADALRPFGATPSAIDNLATAPRYALVGSPSPLAAAAIGVTPDSPEASPTIVGNATGRLQGVLQLGHDGTFGSITSFVGYAPVEGDVTKPEVSTNYELFHIRADVDEDWPVPVAGDAGQAAAFHYLSTKATGHDNVRTYYKAQGASLTAWHDIIAGTSYATAVADEPGAFDEAAFLAVRTQLVKELAAASLVNGLDRNLQLLLTQQNLFKSSILSDTFSQVQKTLEVSKDAKLGEALGSLFLEGLGLGAEVSGFETIGPVLGLINAEFKAGFELANDENGNDEGAVGTTVEELRAELPKQFAEMLTGQSQLFSGIYGNWGKLEALAEGLQRDPQRWDVQLGNAGQTVQAANDAVALSFWRVLIGVSYQRYEAKGAPTADMNQWCLGRIITDCQIAGHDRHAPRTGLHFFELGKNAYTYRTAAPGLNFGPADDNVLLALPGGTDEGVRPLPVDVMDKITDVGGYAPYVILRWPMVSDLVCPQDVALTKLAFYSYGLEMYCNPGALGAAPAPSFTISTTTLPNGVVGADYRTELKTSDGAPRTHVWTVAAGALLPPGIVLSTDGVLSGVPSTSGAYSFSLTAQGAAARRLTLTVTGPAPLGTGAPVTGPATGGPVTGPGPAPTGAPVTGPGLASTGVPVTGPGLASTGVPVTGLAGLAVALLLAGALLVLLHRRRRMTR